MRALILALLVFAPPVGAEILVPNRSIRPDTILSAEDFRVQAGDIPGALTNPAQVDGMEARIALYAGRPVLAGDVGPPALVDRNAIVRLVFSGVGLEIVAEGRALGRGTAGEGVRVMNLASRNTLFGIIQPDGSVKVER